MTATGLIDITKGTLMLEGDRRTQIEGFIATGRITAYGGAGTVVVTYNGQTTTVVAIGAPEATEPSPADDATDVPRDVTLSWKPGEYADKHDVYFGTSFSDVNDASKINPLGVLAIQNQDANTYDPVGLLEFGKTYYWRIDEVNAPPTSHIVFKGDIWKFTVEPFA